MDNSANNSSLNTGDNASLNTGDNVSLNTGDNASLNTGDNTSLNSLPYTLPYTIDNSPTYSLPFSLPSNASLPFSDIYYDTNNPTLLIHFHAFAFYFASILRQHLLIDLHAFHFFLNIPFSSLFHNPHFILSLQHNLISFVSREPAVPLDEPSILLEKESTTDISIKQTEEIKIAVDEKISKEKKVPKEKKEKVPKEKKEKIPKENKEKVAKVISGYNIPNEKQDLILSLINNANKR